MKVIINQQELEAAVIAFFGLPIDTVVELENAVVQNTTQASETTEEQTPEVSTDDLVEPVETPAPKKRRKRKTRKVEEPKDEISQDALTTEEPNDNKGVSTSDVESTTELQVEEPVEDTTPTQTDIYQQVIDETPEEDEVNVPVQSQPTLPKSFLNRVSANSASNGTVTSEPTTIDETEEELDSVVFEKPQEGSLFKPVEPRPSLFTKPEPKEEEVQTQAEEPAVKPVAPWLRNPQKRLFQ